MPESLTDINVKQLLGLPNVQGVTSMGDDLFLLDLRYDRNVTFLEHPCRIDSYAAFFCKRGNLDIEINLKTCHVREHSLIVCTPGNIVRVASYDQEGERPDFIALVISKAYLSSFQFDLNKLAGRPLGLFNEPVVQLDGAELEYCIQYLELLQRVMAARNLLYKRETVGSLVSSLFYLFVGLLNDRQETAPAPVPAVGNRNALLLEQFMNLVAEYHLRERGTAFYAGRLGLTPKYLSKLVRQTSGRSAPEWINAFVVMEAKSLLKYSTLSIKEIVYRLGFPNSSVFYKFFRNHTGMTPTAYRNY